MFIKLTNATDDLERLPIAINSEVVIAVYESPIEKDSDQIGTYVYSAHGQTWQVKESLAEVIDLLNK